MLLKSRISQIDMLEGMGVNEHWRAARNARFTSSKASRLCKPEGLGVGGMNYIRTRVFEKISGVSSEVEFMTQASVNGLVEESFAIRKYAKQRNISAVIVQKLIYGENDFFSSTPDAIYPISESSDGLSYECETWEVKNYAPEKHMICIEAETPLDVRRVDPDCYWQSLDASVNCGSLIFKIIYHNSDMPEDKGGLHVIDGKQNYMVKDAKTGKPTFPIVDDIKFLKQRKQMAVDEFNRLYKKYCKL